MRHETLENGSSLDAVDLARLWPNGLGPGAVPLAEVEAALGRPATAVPDVPAAVGGMLAGVYVTLLGTFPLLIANDASSLFVIAISGFYLFMFLATPAAFLRLEADTSGRPDLSRFLAQGMQTATGHISGAGALVQMLVVPVLLTFAVAAIGIVSLVL